MSNLIPANSAIPISSLKKITKTLHDSISRVSTGLRVLGGNDAGSQSVAHTLTAHAKSFEVAEANNQSGVNLLELAESALLELNALTTRLKELGIQDTLATNTSSDTAALNAEAVAVSDSIDLIVSTIKYNNLNILHTSAKTFVVGVNDAGSTHTIKTTIGIPATDINDATNSNNSADTTLGQITQSLGHLNGSMTALKAYRNVANTAAAHLLQAAANLQDTDYAIETAKIAKQSLLKNYAIAMVATANTEELRKLSLLA